MIIGDMNVTGGMMLLIAIVVSWICSTILAIVTKKISCLDYAFWFSIYAGIGYLILAALGR